MWMPPGPSCLCLVPHAHCPGVPPVLRGEVCLPLLFSPGALAPSSASKRIQGVGLRTREGNLTGRALPVGMGHERLGFER